MEFLHNLYTMFVEMSFYMAIGLLLTGVLNVFFNREWIAKQIGKRSLWSVIKASLLGVPLPICSCGVVPTAVYLHKNGASRGSVTSFLTSTPQTGVDSVVATYGLMGPLLAIFRPIAAFISGVFVGAMTDILVKDKVVATSTTDEEEHCCCHSEPKVEEEHCCCCGDKAEEKAVEEEHCCCHSEPKVEEEHCCCHSEPKVEEEHCCCHSESKPAEEHDCCHSEGKSATNGVWAKVKSVFAFAYGKSLKDISVEFVIGIVVASLITTFIPEGWLSSSDSTIVTMLIMLVVGIPMYICSTGSIPIAVALMASGVTPGAAFVFLFVGPMTNIASLIILGKTLGGKTVAVYLTCASVCAIAMGLLLDGIVALLGSSGILGALDSPHHGTPIYMVVVACIFGVLLAVNIVRKYVDKAKHKQSSCCHCQ